MLYLRVIGHEQNFLYDRYVPIKQFYDISQYYHHTHSVHDLTVEYTQLYSRDVTFYNVYEGVITSMSHLYQKKALEYCDDIMNRD